MRLALRLGFAALRLVTLFLLDRVVPRAPVVVFCSMYGYGGNSRVMYDAWLRAGSKHRLVWIVPSPRLAERLRGENVDAYPEKSWPAWLSCVRAAMWVTDSEPPLGWWRWRRNKRKIVQLWHGVGPKSEPPASWTREARMAMAARFRRFDVIVTSSLAAVPHYQQWGLGDRVRDLGYPRHDQLVALRHEGGMQRASLMRHGGWSGPGRVIMYAPTWRHDGHVPEIDWSAWRELLIRYDAYLLLRVHPTRGKELHVPDQQRFGVIDSAAISDITELLPGVDVLITDYSSIAFDFLVLDRPMIFYLYEHESMVASRGVWLPTRDFPGKVCYSFPEVLTNLTDVLGRGDDGECRERRARARRLYLPTSDGHATERVLRTVQDLVE